MGFKAQTCWTELLAFLGVWNRSEILIFGPDLLFSGFLEPWSQVMCDGHAKVFNGIHILTAQYINL